MARRKRYVLLDRDGTVAVDMGYQRDPSITELFPNSRAGLELLKRAGFGLVLVTNQSGIDRGKLTADDAVAVNRSVEEKLGGAGFMDGCYYCPHVPDAACSCRKPEPGMALRAAEELGFDLADAFVVGDRDCDVGLARAVGATAVLVRTGGGRETERCGDTKPDYVADDLLDAAKWIIRRAEMIIDN